MSDLVVIVPSRGRPENVWRLQWAWKDTAATAELVVCLDDDDPADYPILHPDEGTETPIRWTVEPHLGMAGTLNAHAVTETAEHSYIGFMGDDHLPRTPGWDKLVIAALKTLRTGIAYCNDLFQGPNLPTAAFMTSDIVRTLGYMCPPGFRHLYLDNVWKAWGAGLGKLRYLPDVVIEHMHPQAGGKAEWDDGYRRVNSGDMWKHDSAVWGRYRLGDLEVDIAKLRSLL